MYTSFDPCYVHHCSLCSTRTSIVLMRFISLKWYPVHMNTDEITKNNAQSLQYMRIYVANLDE